MLNPEPPGAGVCEICSTFTPVEYARCIGCNRVAAIADAVLPISYSLHQGQLHRALAGYKRSRPPASRRFELQLAAVLWRFLDMEGHERCLAAACGVDRFTTVTTVPSSSRERDPRHPLRRIVGELVRPTAKRYRPVLTRSETSADEREFDARKFDAGSSVESEAVLLVDDTWASGANVQSAAAALKEDGADVVGVVVFGRHVHEDFGDNAARLAALPRPFDWTRCARG